MRFPVEDIPGVDDQGREIVLPGLRSRLISGSAEIINNELVVDGNVVSVRL